MRLYGEWIAARKPRSMTCPRFRPAAIRHMELADDALKRMQAGWALVGSDPIAAAFRWANEAMLYQQVRSNFPLREVERGKDDVLRVRVRIRMPVRPERSGGRGVLPDRLHPGQPAGARRPDHARPLDSST